MDPTQLYQPVHLAEPPWMATARHLIGQAEVHGPATNTWLRASLKALGAWWQDDETAWCGTFVATCLHDNGMSIPKAWYRARAYEEYGRPVRSPIPYGAVVVLDRPPKASNGHVAFYVGPCGGDKQTLGGNRAYLLGGNQDNQVCVRSYPLARVIACRWPREYPLADYKLPTSTWFQITGANTGMHVPPSGSDA